MCSGSDFTYYRSKYGRVLCDDRNGILNCGSDTANYKYLVSYYRNHLNLEKEGADIVDTCLRRAKEKKMEKKNEKVYAFLISQSYLKKGGNEIRFQASNKEQFVIKRIELALKYGDVKTHGHF